MSPSFITRKRHQTRDGSCRRGHLGGLVGLLWGAVAVSADQPLAVVGVDEAGHGLAELADGVVQLRPQALRLEVRIQRSAQPLVSGSPRNAASSLIPSQPI